LKRQFLAISCSVLMLLPMGCSTTALGKAQTASNVIAAIFTIAQDEVGAIPVQDQAIYSGFVTLGLTLNSQLNTCIGAAGSQTGKAAFLACFNTFVQGLNSPTELAQLRLLSGKTQGTVQKYLVAVITGVNVAFSFFGGTPATAPTVGTAPTAAELHELQRNPRIQLAMGL